MKNNKADSATDARQRMLDRMANKQGSKDATSARQAMIDRMTDNDSKKPSLSQEDRVKIQEALRMGEKTAIYLKEIQQGGKK